MSGPWEGLHLRQRDRHHPTRFAEAAPRASAAPETRNIAMKNIFQTIRHWQRGNATAKMLNRLDDRMLADIGIARGDIRKAVRIFH